MKKTFLIAAVMIFLTAAATLALDNTDALDRIMAECTKSYKSVNDYTARLNKMELVKGRMVEQKNVVFKFMKPGSFYMKWTEGKGKGAEAIFVSGKNNDELLVHLGGFLNLYNFSIDPEGNTAMKNNRHSIYDAGIGRLLELIEENYSKAKKNGEGEITILKDETVNKRETMKIKAVFPEGKGYYAHIIEINIDRKLSLPIKVSIYGWESELWERYHYDDLKINAGLTKDDFDEENKEYGF